MLLRAMEGFKRNQSDAFQFRENERRYAEEQSRQDGREQRLQSQFDQQIRQRELDRALRESQFAVQDARAQQANQREIERHLLNMELSRQKLAAAAQGRDPLVQITQGPNGTTRKVDVPYSQISQFPLDSTVSESASLDLPSLDDAIRQNLIKKHGELQAEYLTQSDQVGKPNFRDAVAWLPGVASDQQQVSKLEEEMAAIERELIARQPVKKITTEEDFNALPSGTKFEWNGRQGVKP